MERDHTRDQHLGEDDSHGQVLAVSRHISQHHDPRQPQVSTGLAQEVDHSCHASTVHDHLGQLQTHSAHYSGARMCVSSVNECVLQYLWCVFHHLPHQSGDVLPHVLIRVFEAGDGCREHLRLNHHLRQADRVLTDLTEGGEHLPLQGQEIGLPSFESSFIVYTVLHNKSAYIQYLVLLLNTK